MNTEAETAPPDTVPHAVHANPLNRAARGVAAILVVGGVLGAAYFNRGRIAGILNPSAAKTAASDKSAGRAVTVVLAQVVPGDIELILPGQLFPWEQTVIQSRIEGLVSKWHVDRGSRVKKGDLMAEISAPELDQAVLKAEADVQQGKALLVQMKADLDQAVAEKEHSRAQIALAEANRDFSVKEVDRTKKMTLGSISLSEVDSIRRNQSVAEAQVITAQSDYISKEKQIVSRTAAIGTQEATIQGLEASLNRLKEMKGFERITAPFDGNVTKRYAEVGMFVQTNQPHPLFHIQNSSVLRIEVDVPQKYAQAAKKAKTAQMIVPETPDIIWPVEPKRYASALNPVTHTFKLELEMDNPNREVFAGSHTQVKLTIPREEKTIIVPTNAVRHTPLGIEAVLAENGYAKVVPVRIGRDYGKAVEIVSGLKGGEMLVTNPPDDMLTGDRIQVTGTRPKDEVTPSLTNQWPAK